MPIRRNYSLNSIGKFLIPFHAYLRLRNWVSISFRGPNLASWQPPSKRIGRVRLRAVQVVDLTQPSSFPPTDMAHAKVRTEISFPRGRVQAIGPLHHKISEVLTGKNYSPVKTLIPSHK